MICRNPQCRCHGNEIETDSYCSDACREHAESGSEGCGCGHGECSGH